MIIDGHHSGDAEVGVSRDGIVNLKVLFERVAIDLRRLDLCKVVLDVNKIVVGNDRHQDLLTIFKEGVAGEIGGQFLGF